MANRVCIYCASPEFKKHKGFCLTLMEGDKEQWVEAKEPNGR